MLVPSIHLTPTQEILLKLNNNDPTLKTISCDGWSAKVCKALIKNTHVTELIWRRLALNELSQKTTARLFVRLITQNQTLTKLTLCFSKTTAESTGKDDPIDVTFWNAFTANKTLKEVSIVSDNQSAPLFSPTVLGGSSSITSIYLRICTPQKQKLEELFKNQHLGKLIVDSSEYDGAFSLGWGFGSALKEHPLVQLRLAVKVNAEFASSLRRGLWGNQNLKVLSLANCTGDGNAIAELLAQCINECAIEELYLDNVKLTNEGASELFAALGRNRTLIICNLNDNDITDIITWDILGISLEGNETLERLSLFGNSLDGDETYGIGRGITENRKLQCLQIGPDVSNAFEYVFKAMQHHPALTDLTLNETITVNHCAQIASLLQTNRVLRILTFTNIRFVDANNANIAQACMKALAAGLARLPSKESLEELNFYDCYIGDAAGEILAKSLLTNRSLRILRLVKAEVGMQTLNSLTEASRINQVIIGIDLSENAVPTEHSPAVTKMLEELWANLLRNSSSSTLPPACEKSLAALPVQAKEKDASAKEKEEHLKTTSSSTFVQQGASMKRHAETLPSEMREAKRNKTE